MALRFNENFAAGEGTSLSPFFIAKATALVTEIRLMVNLRKAAEYATFNFGTYGFDTLNQMSKNFETRLNEIITGAPGASAPEKWLAGVNEFIFQLETNWPYFGQAKTKMDNVKQLAKELMDDFAKRARQGLDWAPLVAGGIFALWVFSKVRK